MLFFFNDVSHWFIYLLNAIFGEIAKLL